MTAPTVPHELQAISAAALSRPPLDPVHQAVVDERKADFGVGRPAKRPTRDALVAVQYDKLRGLQPHVLARIERAVMNEADPLHEMVMEKMMQRVVPVAFWEGLGKQEFKDDDAAKASPSVTIIVNGGAGIAPRVDVVSEQ